MDKKDKIFKKFFTSDVTALNGVSQLVIHARKQRIFEKIKKIIEN